MNPADYEKLSVAEAITYQHELRKRIQIVPLAKPIKIIGGADISFNKYSEIVYAGIIVLSYPDLKELERVTVISKTTFPYISGLLAFREVPALMEVWNKLKTKPDLLVLDGQGIAHRRRTGIATHFGLLADVPTIGCAKSRLFGDVTEPGNLPFAQTEILDKDEIIGIALRTKKNCKPILISPGHHVSIAQSVDIIKQCVGKYRIPEPTRRAHLLVNEARVKEGGGNLQQSLF
ncbi:MAG: deoxyribonuclease V [Daejeonella sp.]